MMKKLLCVAGILILFGCSDESPVDSSAEEITKRELQEELKIAEQRLEELKIDNGKLKMENHQLKKENESLKKRE